MHTIVKVCLILAGVIHLLPAVGVLGAERLQALYGVTLTDPSLVLLMRHRALLFAMLGAFLVAAAWLPALRSAAFALGLFSVLSFLVLAWFNTSYNAKIAHVVLADVLALALLGLGALAHVRAERDQYMRS